MNDLAAIKKLIDDNQLDYSLWALARFTRQVIPESTGFDLWLLVLVNLEISRGNACMKIDDIKEKSIQLGWQGVPNDQACRQRIQSSAVIGLNDSGKPLVFEFDKLYLNRFYAYECAIAQKLLLLSKLEILPAKNDIQCINELFAPGDEIDYQKLAAIVTSRHRLTIISGGPGTGKTWTVSRMLAFLIRQNPALKIMLAAPTGKAAARLSQSVSQLPHPLSAVEDDLQELPAQAVTLHRLLGIHRFTHRPRYHKSNPLDCDVVVVDEASMIDQQLMAQLCNALPDHARLILLGDKDQLSSVEAGSVFADLCGGTTESCFNPPQVAWCRETWGFNLPVQDQQFALADQVVVLQKSHRFDDRSAIGQLATWVKQGDSDNSMLLLTQSENDESLIWRQVPDGHITHQLMQHALPAALTMQQADSLQQAFIEFHRYQILCAVWKGAAGVDSINEQLERAVKAASPIAEGSDFYAGKPLMMTSNAHQFDIHNGDIGMVWPDDNNELKVWFECGNNGYRQLSLSQCPQHKTAYAMTVHKSQGSEFEKVLLILPSSDVAVSTRELFYTGITRASAAVEIWASEARLRATIDLKTQRVSGLMQRLKME